MTESITDFYIQFWDYKGELLLQMFIGIGILLFLIQCFWWLFLYTRLSSAFKKASPQPLSDELPPLSVILVAQDSGEMLNRNLPKILEQDYPNFEVIVVYERNKGNDEDVLKLLESRYSNLYHTFIPETARYISRKKLGISVGIKASKHEWIVLTEPNCFPESNKWLRSLAAHFTSTTEIVLGYSNFTGGNSSFSRRVVIDTLFQSMRYLGRALAGSPQFGVGRNLAYRKSSYLNHRGFAGQLNLARGDDDLLVNTLATRENTAVAVGTDSIIRTEMPQYKRNWYTEKISHLVTSSFYKGCAGVCNGIETCSAALFHLIIICSILMAIIFQQWIILSIAVLLWMVRFIMIGCILTKTRSLLKESYPIFIWFFDLIRPLWALQIKIKYYFRTKADYLRK